MPFSLTFSLEPSSIMGTTVRSPHSFTIPSSWMRKCFARTLLHDGKKKKNPYIHVKKKVGGKVGGAPERTKLEACLM